MLHVDIHAHLLPFVDDGPSTVDDAVKLAKQFLDRGTDRVVVTPHGFSTSYHVSAQTIRSGFIQFKDQLAVENVSLSLKLGMEIHYHAKIIEKILLGEALYFGQDQLSETMKISKMRYVLIELPSREWPKTLSAVIYELSLRNIQVIIAHPERNLVAQQSDKVINESLDEGAWLQLTAGSITGQFGHLCQRISKKWLSERKVHLIASDAHDSRIRQAGIDRALFKMHEWNLDDVSEQCLLNAENIWSEI